MFCTGLRILGIVVGIVAFSARAEASTVQLTTAGHGKESLIQQKTIAFRAVETDPMFSLPSTTTDYPHCLSDGSLVLQSIDWNAVLRRPKGTFPKYNPVVTIVHGKQVQTILAARVSGFTDFAITDTFPSDSGVYFLMQATKEQSGERGPGKSPAGIPLKDYRNYVAHFDLDGSYKEATELDLPCDLSQPGSCELRHLAVFPSGDMLVTESDPETSTLKVLYLKSSGEAVKQIDVPASRIVMNWGDASSNAEVRREAASYLASVYFTPVGSNIVVWRANSNEPVVEVSQGGGVREVPIQIPDGWRFADMVAANDRWVVHFKTENTPPNVRMSADTDAYYDVRPQDGSLIARIVQTGAAPLSIACESDGVYSAFKMNDAGKMVLLNGQ